MGSKKKDRAKARKAGKAAFAALKEAVAKAQVCTPAAATALLQMTTPGPAQGAEQPATAAAAESESPLTMTLPPATTAAAPTTADTADGPSSTSPQRLRFEYHTPASLPKAWREPLFQIFKANMQAEYERNWGYREAEKRAEIFAPEARFLVAVAPEDEEPPQEAAEQGEQGAGKGQGNGGRPLGFVHLRYVLDEDDEQPADAAVLYIYEIQLAPCLQRRGVGGRLMALSERLAVTLGLRKMKLTVFRTNKAAMAFYREKLGYAVDASSPSKWGVDECYEILSKVLVA